MSAGIQVLHRYTPQTSVLHVVNAEFLGLYDLNDLPRYFRPTAECVAFSQNLIDVVVAAKTGVEFVLSDEDFTDRSESMRLVGMPGALNHVIGAEGLEELLEGRLASNPQSWLWDKGPLKRT